MIHNLNTNGFVRFDAILRLVVIQGGRLRGLQKGKSNHIHSLLNNCNRTLLFEVLRRITYGSIENRLPTYKNSIKLLRHSNVQAMQRKTLWTCQIKTFEKISFKSKIKFPLRLNGKKDTLMFFHKRAKSNRKPS